MTPVRWAAALAAAGIMCGCGPGTPGESTSSTPPTSESPSSVGDEWPLPSSSEEVLAALEQMPGTLAGGTRTGREPGLVVYELAGGTVTLEASEVEDVFADEGGTPAEAVDELARQFDEPPSACMAPPLHCVRGTSEGLTTMLWGRDGGEVLLVAQWPDDAAGDALREAWVAAQPS